MPRRMRVEKVRKKKLRTRSLVDSAEKFSEVRRSG